MSKTLFLHVGLPKTGSSSIQYFLASNAKKLFKKGLHYPNLFGEVENTLKVKIGSGNGHAISRVLTGAKKGTKGQTAKTVFAVLSKALIRAEGRDLLISSEGLYKISSKKHIERIHEIAKSHGYSIKVIIYLRRQDQALTSIYNQKVKRHRQTSSLVNWVSEFYKKEERLKFYSLLERLSSQYGKENIIPRVFERQQLKNNDLIYDFCSVLGIEMSKDFVRSIGKKNPSLSEKSVELMRQLNYLNPTKTFTNRYMDVEQVLQDNLGVLNQKDKLPYELANEVVQFFNEENKKVASEYFGRKDGVLFQSMPTESTPEELTFSTKEISLVFGGLLLNIDRTIKKMEKQIEALKKDSSTPN